ncbi:MAG: response regulator [Opitutaceae bacterium]|nr:response regulator [Opitutaceae bacterium]
MCSTRRSLPSKAGHTSIPRAGAARAGRSCPNSPSAPGRRLSLYAPSTAPHAGASIGRYSVKSSAGKAIVLVDDEKSYLDLLSQLLADHVANPVFTFTRPLAALEALPQLDVGMIVTDYYMPQLTGLEFIVRAKEMKPRVPFLIITGHGVHLSADDFVHLPELKGVLHKPFSWHTLATEIVRHWSGTGAPVIRRDAAST